MILTAALRHFGSFECGGPRPSIGEAVVICPYWSDKTTNITFFAHLSGLFKPLTWNQSGDFNNPTDELEDHLLKGERLGGGGKKLYNIENGDWLVHEPVV
jgi:hypothetical protein